MAIINDRTAVTTPVTADALFATAIGAAAATKASFAEMGGLEVDEQTPSGNITGAVGKHYIITTTSLAADMDITVPSASVGERMRVTCVTDEPDYEIIIKGAASQTINGGSAATEWSRIFIAGETVELVCTAANTWWVCHDGRIPQYALADWEGGSVANHFAVASWTSLPLDTVIAERGAITTTDATNPYDGAYVTVRRSGVYLVTTSGRGDNDAVDGAQMLARLASDPTGTPVDEGRMWAWQMAATSTSHDLAFSGAIMANLSAADQINAQMYISGGNAMDANSSVIRFEVKEVL